MEATLAERIGGGGIDRMLDELRDVTEVPVAGTAVVLVTLELIGLTKLDGRVAYVNPEQVVQLSETMTAIGKDNRQFTNEVSCVVELTGSQYVTVRETCDQIRELMTGEHRKPPP